MNNLNQVLIEGNLVRDPDYKGSNGMEKEVSFFDVETWAKLAEACNEKGKKGRGCRVVGRLKQDRWYDNEGKQRSKVVIVAEHVEFRPEFNKTGTTETPPPENTGDVDF